jgi:hypothetical protein
MRSINAAIDRMMRQHEPFPALLMDQHWTVLRTNRSAPEFFGRFIDLASREQPRNMLHLMFDPNGMRPFIANWDEVAASLLLRVRRESVGGVADAQTRALIAELLAYPDTARAKPDVVASATLLPVIPMTFRKDGRLLSYFSMLTVVGTPQTANAQELRLESMFPANEETEAYHPILMGT